MSVLWAHVSLGFQDNNVNLLKLSYTSIMAIPLATSKQSTLFNSIIPLLFHVLNSLQYASENLVHQYLEVCPNKFLEKEM